MAREGDGGHHLVGAGDDDGVGGGEGHGLGADHIEEVCTVSVEGSEPCFELSACPVPGTPRGLAIPNPTTSY